ncbi:hypothetical protein ACFY00_31390 [Kitasatospora sp. NPDC001540]|uniref:hypothetical protein n=1 Tax=Kitasatospora sp. NPDC001540 TaxID=3364014 RepID=UPI0036B376BB
MTVDEDVHDEGVEVAADPVEQVGPVPWLVAACVAGFLLAYFVLTHFTDQARAALWGEPGTATGVQCLTYDNSVANAGTSTSCSGSFTPDGGSRSFRVRVDGGSEAASVRAWRADGSSDTVYVSPTAWAGVFPLGLSVLLVGLPTAVTVAYAGRARKRRTGRRGPVGR